MTDSKTLTFPQKVKYFISILISFLLLSAIGELTVRLLVKIPSPPYDNKQKDELLGWKPIGGYHFQTEQFPDNKGGKYPVNLTFDKHGFRKWDTTCWNKTKQTIFFVGDSYVESLQASDKDVFYSIFSDSLPFRVFASGTSGYGTTQEFLVMRQFLDSVQPHVVVLEMCANDFADNYWELEEVTGYKVGIKRPYLNLSNVIEYHHPHYWINDVKEYSLFYYFLLTKGKNALTRLNILSTASAGDRMIAEKGLSYEKYLMAYQLTRNCLKNMNTLLVERGVRLVVFIADDFEPSTTNIKKICRENNIDVIATVGKEVRNHENSGETVRAYDGYHWNPAGQRIVASEIIKYFRERK